MTISGIPVRIDYRWFLVLALMSAIIAVNVEPLVNDVTGSIMLGLSATIVFFASILMHEFAHAVVARMEGLQVVEIVLHPFGGLARFRHPPETPRAEFRIAIAGPAASFLLTILFGLLLAASSYVRTDILTLLLFFLALSNFLLAVFNLFPGYPLDGGRVLRAYLWKHGRDLNEATILTGRCGQLIAAGLIVLGLVIVILRAEIFTGVWAVLVGIFLFDSASGIIREVNADESVLVEDIMSLPAAVSPDSSIQYFVDTVLPMHRRTAFAVAREKEFLGLLLLDDMKEVDRDFWSLTFVREVMRKPADDLIVPIGASLAEAKFLMNSNNAGVVVVLDEKGSLVGIVHRGSLKKLQ